MRMKWIAPSRHRQIKVIHNKSHSDNLFRKSIKKCHDQGEGEGEEEEVAGEGEVEEKAGEAKEIDENREASEMIVGTCASVM